MASGSRLGCYPMSVMKTRRRCGLIDYGRHSSRRLSMLACGRASCLLPDAILERTRRARRNFAGCLTWVNSDARIIMDRYFGARTAELAPHHLNRQAATSNCRRSHWHFERDMGSRRLFRKTSSTSGRLMRTGAGTPKHLWESRSVPRPLE